MEDKLISFEVAKLAKSVGFNSENFETIPQVYSRIGILETYERTKYNLYGDYCYAPTQTLLQTWLRDKIGVMVWVEPIYYDGWLFACNVSYPNGDYEAVGIEDGSWEDQLEEGLKKGLEFLNKKK